MELNNCSGDLETTIGRTAKRELDALTKYLGIVSLAALDGASRIRFAPSVIVRSEILPFNLDIPRFAVRFYLDANKQSFINIRRMRELRDRVLTYQPLPPSNQRVRLQLDGRFEELKPASSDEPAFVALRQRMSAIADCLLAPPPPVRDRYNIVQAELGWCYGECGPSHGVPYVRPLAALGGSGCAQACAFMVSASLTGRTDDDTRPLGVHGLAEITALTSEPYEEHVKLAGMTGARLMRYFGRIHRTAFQYSFTGDNERNSIFDCIDVHVRSGFPVVISCRGNSEYTLLNPDHAIVAVGTAKADLDTGERPVELLINNPSGRPFERWDADALQRHCVRGSPTGVGSALIIATPSYIRLPLTLSQSSANAGRQLCAGVLELAKILDLLSTLSGNSQLPTCAMRQFYLTRLRLENCDGGLRMRFPDDSCPLPRDPGLREAWQSAPQLRPLAGHWCWIQSRRGQTGAVRVSLWDAEREAPEVQDLIRSGDPTEYLLLEMEATSASGEWAVSPRRGWGVDSRERPGSRVQESRAAVSDAASESNTTPTLRDRVRALVARVTRSRTRIRPLAPGLITSVSANSLQETMATWPEECSNAELYCFMHRDDGVLGHLRSVYPTGSRTNVRPSAMQLTSHAFRSEKRSGLLDELATRIDRTVSGRGDRIRIGAAATYIPQLFSHQPEIHEEGQDALLGIMLLIERMRERGHHIRVLELVVGSTIAGVFPAYEENGAAVLAMRRRLDADPLQRGADTPADSISYVVDRLRDLIRRARAAGIEVPALAIELEPGPLFALRDQPQLEAIAKVIDSDPILGPVVGFNVDIAHYALARISPATVFASDAIARRILNFHISDHSVGHFGDCPLGHCSLGTFVRKTESRFDVFREWLRETCRYARQQEGTRSNGLPVCSGQISLELEAAKSATAVQQSFSILAKMLDEQFVDLERNVTSRPANRKSDDQATRT